MRNFRHPLVVSAAMNFAFLIPFINRGVALNEIPYILMGFIACMYSIYWNVCEPDDDQNGLVYKYLINLWLCSELIHISPSAHKLAWSIFITFLEITIWVYLNPVDKTSNTFERDTIIWQIIHSTKAFLIATILI